MYVESEMYTIRHSRRRSSHVAEVYTLGERRNTVWCSLATKQLRTYQQDNPEKEVNHDQSIPVESKDSP